VIYGREPRIPDDMTDEIQEKDLVEQYAQSHHDRLKRTLEEVKQIHQKIAAKR
jgi:hypothetical protein